MLFGYSNMQTLVEFFLHALTKNAHSAIHILPQDISNDFFHQGKSHVLDTNPDPE